MARISPPIDGGAEEGPDRAEHVGDLVGISAPGAARAFRGEGLADDLAEPREHLGGLLALLGERLACVPMCVCVQLVVLAPAPALGRSVDAQQAVRRH